MLRNLTALMGNGITEALEYAATQENDLYGQIAADGTGEVG